MNVKSIIERNVGAMVGQLIVAVSELEAACAAKDAEIAKLREEMERRKKKPEKAKP